FGVRLHWLPPSGIRPIGSSDWNPIAMAPYLVMPTIVLGTGLLAYVARFVRSSMLEALGQDYIRTARAKGLRERIVVLRHALRNSLLPVITIVGFILPLLIGTFAVALLAAVLAPYEPNAQILAERLAGPSLAHPFGQDHLGRDVLSRAIYGARVSLGVGFSSVAITIVIGTIIGVAAGYF